MELRSSALAVVVAVTTVALLAPRSALAADPQGQGGQVIELDEPSAPKPAPTPPAPPPATPPAQPSAVPAAPAETAPATAPATPKGTLRFAIQGSNSEKIHVVVDNLVVAGAALRTLPLEVRTGHQTVVATLGNVERRQEVEVVEGKSQTVVLDFTGVPEPPDDAAPASATVQPPTEPKKHADYTIALVGGGIAVVGLAIGLVETFVALGHKSTLKSSCASDGSCGPAQHSELDSAKSAANIATVGYIVAGVGIGVGVAGFVIARNRADNAPATGPGVARASRGVTFEPWIGLGSAGLRGAF